MPNMILDDPRKQHVYNVRKNNTLRMDPSRTAMIRRRFVQEMEARFRKLEQAIMRAVDKEDKFGLKEKQVATVGRVFAAHARYTALTTTEQLAEFRKWSDSQLNSTVLGGSDRNWLERYIKESYEKGQGRAFDDAMKKYSEKYSEKYGSKMDYYKGKRDEFLRSSFRQPASIERVNLLATRSFMDLKGVTQDMSTKMNRIMTDSIIQGRGPRETGRELNKVVGIGRNRGTTIARTETIRAHADGQLEALKNLGVEEVGVMVEWSSASDDLVCGLCADMDGSVMPIDKAGSIIPLHPNCRCCWLPANIGEDKSRKVWTEKDKEGKAVWRDLEQKSGKDVEKKLDKLGFDKVIGERLPNAFADRVVAPHVVAEPVNVPEVETPKVVEVMSEVKAPVEKKMLDVATVKEELRSKGVMPMISTDKISKEDVLRVLNQVNDEMVGLHERFLLLKEFGKQNMKDEVSLEIKAGKTWSARESSNANGMYYEKNGLIQLAAEGPVSTVPTLGEWRVADDVGSNFRHEFGHHFWYQKLSGADRIAFTDIATPLLEKNVVSVYAKTNNLEMFAESFSAYTHPNYAGGLPKNIEDFLRKVLQ
jgi:SPP1 gp7 family putative phage head morphogenesis protein